MVCVAAQLHVEEMQLQSQSLSGYIEWQARLPLGTAGAVPGNCDGALSVQELTWGADSSSLPIPFDVVVACGAALHFSWRSVL
jgi:hypothetical protein